MKKEIYPITYRLEENYWWYVARRKIIIDHLASFFHDPAKKRKKPTLLDFGCGTGINLKNFSKYFEAYGLDSSIEAIGFCSKRGLNNVRLFDEDIYNGMNPFQKKFDVVTLLDVLEHLNNEAKYLSLIAHWLKESGILFLTVPAFQWVWSGEDYVSNHFRRYTKKKLVETLNESGFKIIKVSYFNFLLFPLQVMIVFINKIISPSSQTKTNLKEMPNWINSLLENVMYFESSILRKYQFPFGGSILCVCQKNKQ